MAILREKTSHAVKWSALDVFMRQGIQLIVLIVLARLLTPEDFGVIAMLALFVGLAGIFIDSGFSSALIQRQSTTLADESTVFFFNLMMGTVVALLLCFLAPFISTFFKQPILQFLTYAMAFNLFLNAFGSIHTTLLTKEMNLAVIAKVGAAASAISGLLAILLAYQGFGVWSLVAQTIAASVISVSLLWLWHPWRPVWAFNVASLRSFFVFGGYEMAANLTDVFSTNLYLILIGKLFSARDVGLYDRAQKTQQLPIVLMTAIINRVVYVAFASASADKDKLVRGLRKAQALAMFLNTPLLLGMILLAKPLILTLMGEQWGDCVPVFQVLGLAGLLWPMHLLNLSLLKAQGRSDLYFKITIFKKILTISLTVAASFYGIMAIAWAQLASSIFAFFVNAHYTKVLLNYGALKQLRDIAACFVALIPMAAIITLVISINQLSPLLELFVATIVGGGTYLLTCRWFWTEALFDFLGLIGRKSQLFKA